MKLQNFFLAAILLISASSAAAAETFLLQSPSFKPNKSLPIDHVFQGFGCEGKNVSPEIVWRGAPKNAKSFAVTLYDPDAPTGSGWWHWVVVNIPASVSNLPSGAGMSNGAGLPAGARQIRTDFGNPGFGGACPPQGRQAHRYVLTVYALNVATLDLPDHASAALAGFMIQSHKIAQASITALYQR